jgi:nucleotide-binding universal stress UspA family protein
MYEKILIPLDGSELAEIVLPFAEELAGALDSEVILIHVSESAEDKLFHTHQLYMEKMVEDTKQSAQRYLHKTVKVDSVHLVGHAAEQIVDYADKENIGLIVMATHGRSGIRRWFMGEVASKVVRAAERPVALIRARDARPDARQKSLLNKVLVPLDGSEISKAVIPYIGELASKLKAEVILYRVVALTHTVYSVPGEVVTRPYSPEQMAKIMTKSEGYLESVGAELGDKGINVRYEVGFGVAAEEIIGFADEIQADLVAMSTHGHSGVRRWALGSTADKVLHAGNTPILLVRAPGATKG